MKTMKKIKKRRITEELIHIPKWTMYLLLYGMLMFGLMGCSTETRDWRAAQEANNIEALEEYLEKYPDGKFSEDAYILTEDLRFAGIVEQDNIAGYKEYLSLYPEGRFQQNVVERLEALYFSDAQEQDNVAAYEEYLFLYPEGMFRIDAEERIKFLYKQTTADLDERALGNVKFVLMDKDTRHIIRDVKFGMDLNLVRIIDPDENEAYQAQVQEYMDKVKFEIDNEGVIHFKRVPPGTYTVILWRFGNILEIIVSPGETIDLGIIEG